jgi:uncharacterized ferritin-like protein (DUF455 family)
VQHQAAVPAPSSTASATSTSPPPEGTVERWAWDYVARDSWELKLDPPPVPTIWEAAPPPRRIERPGRGSGFAISAHGEKSTGKSRLRSEERRTRLMHAFMHHELQAAELMCWALLAFPAMPVAFKRGLLKITADEISHMHLYAGWLRARGVSPGGLPVRDWFWERVPTASDPRAFVATIGIGLEGGNLDHAARFAARFRDAGDHEAADIEERVGREEIPHVRFALHWFRVLDAELRGAPPVDGTVAADAEEFERWAAALPAPLSPLVMRGDPIARDARARAGLGPGFVDALVAATSDAR